MISDRFNYEIETLIHSLQTQAPTPILNLQANIGIWFRLSQSQQWRSLFISIPIGNKSVFLSYEKLAQK